MKGIVWLKYLGYVALFAGALLLRNYVGARFNEIRNTKLCVDYGLLTIGTLINIVIGVLLGSEVFIAEIKKPGKWKVNLPKLLIIGLPNLYLSLFYVGMYANIPLWKNRAIYDFIVFIINNPGNLVLFQIIFGYVAITSFYKLTLSKAVQS